MASFSFLGAVLDLVGLASTITVIVWLVSGLQPLFERVRDSCRACQPPEGRAQLLWSVFLIQSAWVAAAALYFRILSSLWDYMGTWLENRPVNRPVYALLHLYLYLLLLGGIYAWAITIVEVFQNRKVLRDLVVIARFNTGRYQVNEDAEAQPRSSSLETIDCGTETASVVGNVRNTGSLPHDESLIRNGQGSTEDVAPAEAHLNEPEHPPGEPTSSKVDHPVGGIVTWADSSQTRNSNVKTCRPIGGIRNSSEAAGSSIQYQVIVDSDGDTITVTPSSSSSSSASSGIDELEYVDDDNDGCGLQGVSLRENLEAREQRNTDGLHVIVINQRGCVKRDNDDDPHRLYNATPRLKPQDQNAKIDLEPLDIGEPLSPCDSCSSAHAESIPTAKRSPVRVPITPTSPTADAEDADTERTDVERKTRHRKHRNSALSAPQCPAQQRPWDFEEDTWALRSTLAAQARVQRARTTASKHASSRPKPKAFPAVASDTLNVSLPPEHEDWGTGLFGRSREADDDGSTTSGDEIASTIPSDDDERFMFKMPTETSRRSVGPAPTMLPPRKRPGSPYPFTGRRQAGGAEGGKNTMGVSIEIPDVALDPHDGWGKQRIRR